MKGVAKEKLEHPTPDIMKDGMHPQRRIFCTKHLDLIKLRSLHFTDIQTSHWEQILVTVGQVIIVI